MPAMTRLIWSQTRLQTVDGFQLLRSSHNPLLKQGGDMHQRCTRLAEIGVLSGQCDRRLTRVFCSAFHRRHQPWATGDCLAPCLWIRQSNEQTPPVVDQRHRTRSKPIGSNASMSCDGKESLLTELQKREQGR